MSYDVIAGDRDLNYTSNMRRFFTDFGAYPGDWAGRPRKEVGAEIGEALRHIARRVREDGGWHHLATEYNASNGWGEVRSATKFLIEAWAGCYAGLPDTVKVSL